MTIARKALWHLAVGLIIWLLVRFVSPWGKLYAGWTVALLGACYLLAAWLSWMKTRGTDFGRLLKRKGAPETPFFLRGPDKSLRPRLGLNGTRHSFDDDLEENPDPLEATYDQTAIRKVRAAAWGCTGVLLLLLSAF